MNIAKLSLVAAVVSSALIVGCSSEGSDTEDPSAQEDEETAETTEALAAGCSMGTIRHYQSECRAYCGNYGYRSYGIAFCEVDQYGVHAPCAGCY